MAPRLKIILLLLLFHLLAPSTGATAAPAWLAGYRYRVPVTVENKSTTAQAAMPVDLRFDTMSQILRGNLRTDGADLRVTDENGNEVPRYVEGLQDDGDAARIWVRGTALPAGGRQTFYIYYDNPAASRPAEAHDAVFSNAPPAQENDALHLSFDSLSPDAQPIAGTHHIQPQGVPGYYGQGAWFNGQNAALPVQVPNAAQLSRGFTVAFWMKLFPHTAVGLQTFANLDDVLHILEGEVRLYASDGPTLLTYKTPYHEWTHVAVSYDGATLTVYINGQEAARGPVKGTVTFPRGNLSVGFDPTGGGRFFTPMVLDDFTVRARPTTSFPEANPLPVVSMGAEEVNPAVAAPEDAVARHVYLPIEAEDFDGIVNDKMYESLNVTGKKNWFLSHDRPFLSRSYGIFTLAEGAVASKVMNIPQAGNYRLWVRYAPTGEHEYLFGDYTGSAFQMKVEQNGATAAVHEFGKELNYDPRQSRWESAEVTLKQGPATLVLTKNVPQPNAGEKIDFVLLTDNPDYVPDYRHFNMLWLRFKLLDVQGPGPYRATIRILRHDGNPWYRTVDFKPGEYAFTTGTDSGWIDGMQFIAGASDATFTLDFRDATNKAPQSGKVQLQYARLPRDSSIYKTAVSTSTRSFGFTIPGPQGKLSWLDTKMDSLEAVSAQDLAQARAQQWPPDNTPANVIISASTNVAEYSDEVIRNEISTLKTMGVNLVANNADGYGSKTATEIGAGELGLSRTALNFYLYNLTPQHRLHVSPFTDKFWPPFQEFLDTRIKALRDCGGEAELKSITWVPLNDEVEGWLPPATLLAQPETLAAFKTWLTEHQVTPAAVGAASWDALQIVPSRDAARTPEQKRLWMHEMDFASEVTLRVYKRTSEMAAKTLGHPVQTTIDPSPHGYMFRGFATPEGEGLNFLHFWQAGGVTTPWSEDWSGDNGDLFISSEMMSYVAALNQSGAGHERATGMYITSGNADARRQKIFAALARGARHVDHYTYGPRFATTEGSWSPYPDIFNAIGDIDADIAHADDLLGPAKARRGQVAILYPWSSDVWKTNTSSVAERFYLFLALAHAQEPVDILSEEQVGGGDLSGYKALYVVDDNIRRPAVQQIAKWVNGGGTLVAMLNAGSRDEYDADSRSFDTLLGLNRRVVAGDADNLNGSFHRSGVSGWKQMGEMTLTAPLPTGKVPAYALKATAEVNTARVIGTWADGSPAATINASGQGKAIFIGAFPGLSYVRGSNMGAGYTTDYPAAVRDLITAPATLAGVRKDVELDTPIVEATLQEGEKGAVVTLTNYTMRSIPQVTMKVRAARPVKKVVAVQEQKELPFTTSSGVVTAKLPLGLTEFVKLYY